MREKVKTALEVSKKTETEWNKISAGNEAAMWFIKENYGVDFNDVDIRFMLSNIDVDYLKKGAQHRVSREWFKRKQDENHKP